MGIVAPTHESWFSSSQTRASSSSLDALVGASCFAELADVGLGLRFRSATPGPETDLVEAFLENLDVALPRGRRLTVFCQPALETGFPDIVAVVWRESIARKWRSERELLSSDDLRLIHALAGRGWFEIDRLEGIFRRRLRPSLERLESLDLALITERKCRTRALNSIFAVERIVAIEAKISWWRRALEQAGSNVWFSSESHALMPSVSDREAVTDVAQRFQVGVLQFDDARPTEIWAAPQRPIPASYGSWLFNEWVWRIARRLGDI